VTPFQNIITKLASSHLGMGDNQRAARGYFILFFDVPAGQRPKLKPIQKVVGC
jgi:hypothetical protein